MAFVAVVPEKSLELECDEKLHPSKRDQYLRHALEDVDLGGNGKKVLQCLQGGGIVVQCNGNSAKIATFGSFVAALTGNLQNYGYLVKKYLHEELQLPAAVTLDAIKERKPVTEAELLCRLYAQLGTVMLSKLRGHFSFVIYDSNTVRVLTARDPSGVHPLVEGHFPDNALYVTSGAFHPAGAQDIIEIRPGNYKYGWHASPRKYTNPEAEAKTHAREASSAANEALAGIVCSQPPLATNSWFTGLAPRGRRSLDTSALLAPMMTSLDAGHGFSRRCSLDSAMRNQRQGVECHKSHADEQDWWRSKQGGPPAKPNLSQLSETAEPAGVVKKAKRHRRRHHKTKGRVRVADPQDKTIGSGDNDRSSDYGSDHEMETRGLAAAVQVESTGRVQSRSSGGNQISDSESGQESVEQFVSRLSAVFHEGSTSARMLTNLLGASPCALVVTDACQEDDPIVFVNKQFELSTGYSAGEALGRNCRFLQGPHGAPRLASMASGSIRRALEDGKSTSVKLMNYTKDGSPMWNDLSIVPLRDSEGKITHHVGMQTFTPAQHPSTTHRVPTGMGALVRSRSCSDMNATGRTGPPVSDGLAF